MSPAEQIELTDKVEELKKVAREAAFGLTSMGHEDQVLGAIKFTEPYRHCREQIPDAVLAKEIVKPSVDAGCAEAREVMSRYAQDLEQRRREEEHLINSRAKLDADRETLAKDWRDLRVARRDLQSEQGALAQGIRELARREGKFRGWRLTRFALKLAAVIVGFSVSFLAAWHLLIQPYLKSGDRKAVVEMRQQLAQEQARCAAEKQELEDRIAALDDEVGRAQRQAAAATIGLILVIVVAVVIGVAAVARDR